MAAPSQDISNNGLAAAHQDSMRWVRRAITVPGYSALLVFMVTTLPALLTLAFVADLLRGKSWTCSRVVIFLTYYLACEVTGICCSLAIWILSRSRGEDLSRFRRRNFDLQCWWGRTLGRGAFAIFGLKLEVECDYVFGERPVLVFIRHSSVADTVLPVMLVADQHDIVLRYVLKKELLWDPCLDIVGNRLVNYFVDRHSSNTDRETEQVTQLAIDLSPREGVLIYPEGTRFSAAKKAKVEKRFAARGDEEALQRSQELQHLLPPRTGGALALLAAAPKADVLFLAHSGLEGSSSFSNFWNGGLTNHTVRVKIWAVPSSEIPESAADQTLWLHRQWIEVDRFIDKAMSHDERR